MSNIPPGFPASLRTASLADGQALAQQLATDPLAGFPARDSMPEQLRTSAARPAPEVVAAIYLHAIALANAGWGHPAPTHS